MADDRWSKFTVKSRWMDDTAGGGPAYTSWRDNYQWLLTVPRETEMTFQLSLPDPRLSSANLLALPPIGLMVVQGNGGEHARRRKLKLSSPSEVVFEAGPRPNVRRLQVTTTLPPSPEGAPYIVVPYTASPGAESPFTLSILLDDTDDDGNPDITFEPCLPNPPNREDWSFKRLDGTWARASGDTSMISKNDKLTFTLQSASATEGTVIVCLETRGINMDMRTEEGMQTAPGYPPIGLAVCPHTEALASGLPANAILAGPLPQEGLWLECKLPVGGAPHAVVPYMGPGSQAKAANLRYCLTVYSDLPLMETAPPPPPPPPAAVTSGAAVAAPPPPEPPAEESQAWACELCDVKDGGHGPVCPYRLVIEKMDRMERLMDERMRFLDERMCVPVPSGM